VKVDGPEKKKIKKRAGKDMDTTGQSLRNMNWGIKMVELYQHHKRKRMADSKIRGGLEKKKKKNVTFCRGKLYGSCEGKTLLGKERLRKSSLGEKKKGCQLERKKKASLCLITKRKKYSGQYFIRGENLVGQQRKGSTLNAKRNQNKSASTTTRWNEKKKDDSSCGGGT